MEKESVDYVCPACKGEKPEECDWDSCCCHGNRVLVLVLIMCKHGTTLVLRHCGVVCCQ